jgi:hypothetical protein
MNPQFIDVNISLKCECDGDNLGIQGGNIFILAMFTSKHCLIQMLCPFHMLRAIPRKIQSSLISIVGVMGGAP